MDRSNPAELSRNQCLPMMSMFLWQGDRLTIIDPIANWVSPRLSIRFDLTGEILQLLRPDGIPFTTREKERQQAEKLAAKLRELGVDPTEISPLSTNSFCLIQTLWLEEGHPTVESEISDITCILFSRGCLAPC